MSSRRPLQQPLLETSPAKAEPPFRLPHIDRLHYFDSHATEVKAWPKKKVWPEAQLQEEPFKPPNPATGLVKECKSSIESLKKVIPEEKPYDEEENYVGYSLDAATEGGYSQQQDRTLLSRQLDEKGNPQQISATAMQQKWAKPERKDLYEGPIRDGNTIHLSTCSDFSKRSTKDVDEMSPSQRAQLWKHIHYRGDGVSFQEAEQKLKRENLARLLLCSYATPTRAECERCHPTPATTGTRKNPFLYLGVETAIRCGVRPGLEHLAPLDRPRVHANPKDPEAKDYDVLHSTYIIHPTRTEAFQLEAEDQHERSKRTTQQVEKELEERKAKARRPLPDWSAW